MFLNGESVLTIIILSVSKSTCLMHSYHLEIVPDISSMSTPGSLPLLLPDYTLVLFENYTPENHGT